MKQIKAYLTHPIRGKAGNNATAESMVVNNVKAQKMGSILCLICPELNLYVPADMDDFLIPRGITPVDVIEELLALDCAIIKGCDVLLVYDHEHCFGSGMQREINYARDCNIPTYIFGDYTDVAGLVDFIKKIKE